MDLNCPYCGSELEVCHDDGFGYQEEVRHEMQCWNCEKNFVFTTEISFYYSAEKADCLNGGDHKYKLTNTFPKEFSKMSCEDCDEQREMTDEERIRFKIGTKEDYFKKLKTK